MPDIQPWQGLVGVVIGSGITGLVAYLNHVWTVQRERTKAQRDQRTLAYRELMGHKGILPRLAVARAEAVFLLNYHLFPPSPPSPTPLPVDPQQLGQLLRTQADLHLELIRATQRLHESLGAVQTIFPDDTEVVALIDKLLAVQLQVSYPSPPALPPTTPEVRSWYDGLTRYLREQAAHEYTEPIEKLLAKLLTLIEVRGWSPWRRFWRQQ